MRFIKLLNGQQFCLYPMTPEEQTAFDAMKTELETLKAAPKPEPKAEPKAEPTKEEPDLIAKAKKERDDAEKAKGDTKRIETALSFNMSVDTFVKDHKDILPTELEGILKAAAKETYDSAVEKAAAVKSALVQTFFSVQANLDLLTASQKNQVNDFLKLTKNGKETKAPEIFENVFEPAIETLKKVKKAEELGKARQGFASGSAVEDGYKARLIANSRKMYLNEKGA